MQIIILVSLSHLRQLDLCVNIESNTSFQPIFLGSDKDVFDQAVCLELVKGRSMDRVLAFLIRGNI